VIDIQTFMLVLAVGNIAFATLIAGYARSGPDNPAMRMWQWAKLVQGCGHLLGWLHPDWPLQVLAIGVNSLLIAGIAMEAAAYCIFFGAARWQRLLVPATLLAMVTYGAAHYAGAPVAVRAGIISFIMAVFSGAMGLALLLSAHGSSALRRIIGVNNLLFFGAMIARAYLVYAQGAGAESVGTVQGFVYLTGYVLLIVNGFGFLLLCKEKDDAKMEQLAAIDSLTGLVNRRAFFERTAAARALASRQRHPVSLLMLDLDHFKSINDRYGHAVGDQALCGFAQAALGALRDPDILGRLGGEEFAVALPGTDLDCGPDYAFTVSIGVVLIDHDEHINAALARADRALYVAKSAGRDRVAVGDPIRLRA
jgi:GGDEF domain-containing protein